MTVQPNPFLTYLDEHRGAGPEALKELFRILAKRTHPDLGAEDERAFVRLQEYYHEALAVAMDRRAEPQGQKHGEPPQRTRHATARDRVLSGVYRYRSLLPTHYLEPRDLPAPCLNAFRAARAAAESYEGPAAEALGAFDREFHERRVLNARYPDVRVKYACLLSALASFFDFQLVQNSFNDRVTRSYLDEIHAVTDVDPMASMAMRHNRSVAARSALYRMRTWIEHELTLPPADVLI